MNIAERRDQFQKDVKKLLDEAKALEILYDFNYAIPIEDGRDELACFRYGDGYTLDFGTYPVNYFFPLSSKETGFLGKAVAALEYPNTKSRRVT